MAIANCYYTLNIGFRKTNCSQSILDISRHISGIWLCRQRSNKLQHNHRMPCITVSLPLSFRYSSVFMLNWRLITHFTFYFDSAKWTNKLTWTTIDYKMLTLLSTATLKIMFKNHLQLRTCFIIKLRLYN